MFAFCNRRRTSIKILQWDGSGFWILMKRLDRDSFHWSETPDELQKVTMKEMHWLCDGLSLTPKGAFEERHPKMLYKERICQFAKNTKYSWISIYIPTVNVDFSRSNRLFMLYLNYHLRVWRLPDGSVFYRGTAE